MIDMKTKTKSTLFSIFLPERCPYCSNIIKPCEEACVYCRENFPDKKPTKEILGTYPVTSVVPYEDEYKNAILGIKYGYGLQYAYQLAELMCKKLKEERTNLDFDVITYVPMHHDTLEERGFNHSEILAGLMGEILKLPCEELLKKVKKNQPQHELPAYKRQKNVEGAYKVIKKSRVKNRKILLIDDIITTGYTLAECAKELRKSEAQDIHFITFAFTIPKTT